MDGPGLAVGEGQGTGSAHPGRPTHLAQAASVGASERRLHGASEPEPPWARGVRLRALCGHALLPHGLPGTGALTGLTDQESLIKTHGSESSKGRGLFEELQLPHHPEPLLQGVT